MLNKEILKKLNTKYSKDETNKVRERLLNKTELTKLITDEDTSLDVEFNIEIKTHGITNQMNSGRCWLFGGLNILREQVIKNCNLNNFELSGSYLAFYDKLEKFNYIIEKIAEYRNNGKDIYDMEIRDLLNEGIDDGGYYTGFANLVKKYGVVPKSIFPETFQSTDTAEIDQILTRLIKKYYIELDYSLNKSEKVKQKYLEYAYKIIANLYGVPKERFDFEYTDVNNKYHIDKNITPKQFYKKYIKLDLLKDYVEIYSYEDKVFKHNNLYEIGDTSRIIGCKNNVVLNLNHNDMKSLLIKQIKDKEPVYFSTSTPEKMIDGI